MSRRGRGGDRRSGREYGSNLLKYSPICLWCAMPFVAARPDAHSCSSTCRSALARYVKKNGQPPTHPFGLKPDPKKKKRGCAP